jgi:hypothetical protein
MGDTVYTVIMIIVGLVIFFISKRKVLGGLVIIFAAIRIFRVLIEFIGYF